MVGKMPLMKRRGGTFDENNLFNKRRKFERQVSE
jgi:hypothetical protein